MHRIRSAAIASFGVLALTAALFTSPAAANDGDRHVGTSLTEDDDTNDGGTADGVVDDGDNAHPSGNDRSVEHGGSGTQGAAASDPDDDGNGPERTNGGPDQADGTGGVDLADQDGNNGCGNDDDFEDDNEGWCTKPAPPVTEDDTAGTESRCDRDADMHADDHASGNTPDSCDHDAAALTADDDDECVDADAMTDDDDSDSCDHDAAAGTTDDDDECVDADAMTDDDDSESCDAVKAAVLASEGETIVVGVIQTVGGGASIEMTPSGDTDVLAASASRPLLARVSGSALAFTGDHILVLLFLALVALVLGTVMLRTTRRSHVEA